jgi:2-amino-4-hydroxy-6-hydroxymethyldihydropteridine diphosphokinase
LIPWLAVDPSATLTVGGERRPVAALLADIDPGERSDVRPTELVLES